MIYNCTDGKLLGLQKAMQGMALTQWEKDGIAQNMGNIILIGYMGSGKSTLGKKAAKAFGCRFLDTDTVIEGECGCTIAKLFEIKGEAYFRQYETDLLKRLLKEQEDVQQRLVLATGGGLPMREENRVLLKQLGTVVYLKARTDTLLKRLSGDTSRPLLAGGALREKIERMLAERGPVYETLADFVLETDDMSFYEMLNRLESL